MSKKIKQIISALLVALTVLTAAPVNGGFTASALNDKTVTAQFIVDNEGKYMETFRIMFSLVQRESNSATINITWTNTINANKYDAWRYDAEVKCGSVTTGRKIVVPKNSWPKGATGADKARSKSASSTLKIPLSTQNETTVNLVCLQYQCDGNGNIRYTEKEKPGTVSYTIPKYTASANTYTLSYNANGGLGAPAAQTGAAKYTLSSTKPIRDGYTFLGWAKSSTAATSEYAPGASITLSANTTMFAVWKKNSTTNIYNLKDETYSFKNILSCEKKSCNGFGHCYGMSVTSSAYYYGVIDKTSVGAETSQSTYSLSNNSKVRKPICYYQNRQSNSTIVAGGRRYFNSSNVNTVADWIEVVNYVKNHNYDDKGSLIVSVKNGNGSGGHAVNFLRYKEVDGQARIYVYDNNYPTAEMYFYKGSDGKIYEYPNHTFGSSNCIALRSFDKCIKYAGDFDGTHVIYAKDGEIEVEGAIINPMDCGDGDEYVLYEIPSNYCEVIVTPLVDNAEFSYLEETYSFGEVGYDTYGVFTLATNNDGAVEGESTLKIENMPQKVRSVNINNTTINYKGDSKIIPEIITDANVSYKVEFSSSNSGVVSVDNNGKIAGNKAGTAEITCTVTDEYGNSTSDVCTVNVTYSWWQEIIRIILFGWIWY